MKGAKKDKKNGKDSGGVVAAVTKHTAGKFVNNNNNANKGSASETETPSPSVQSPELKPASYPSNGIPAASPLLDAVSTTSFATSTTPSTHEWGRMAPGLAGSPGNLISLMGESPPTQPSSYEDSRGLPYGWSSPRPYAHAQPVSASPPANSGLRRPLSFQMDHYPPSEVAAPPSVSPSNRRSSMYAHSLSGFARANIPNPPLPHQAQAHFYGTPDLDLDFQPHKGMKAGEKGYAFAFDTIPSPNADCVPRKDRKDNVVLAGYEGGLEVHSVSKRGLEHIASLKGLRGGVIQAKILPWVPTGHGADLSPLVAVIIHGPAMPTRVPDIMVEAQDPASGERSGAVSPANEAIQREHVAIRAQASVEHYLTSVEIYSLKDSRHVATLLEAPLIPLQMAITSPIFKAPPPAGALRIVADAGTVVVTSGSTGECWIYRQLSIPHEPGVEFRCAGKVWTTIQQPPKTDLQETERSRAPVTWQSARNPIIALNGRWMAYCPAAPSSQISLRARVPSNALGKAPGTASLTPPQLPGVTSDIEVPGAESVMNKFMRDATQELISGAKWVGQQGWQAFNNYWKGTSQQPQPTRSPPLGAQPWSGAYPPRQDVSQFPPTHGTMAPAVSKEPGLIAIVDIETLPHSASVHPISTFPTTLGCSFLSFTPNGLMLFAASTKGDVQTVWDLMRIQHTKASPLQTLTVPAIPNGPRVRQVAQFSRMTVARIVDIAWTRPNGERAAMVTERGTVHLLEMPSSAYTWPPPRRRTRSQEVTGSAEGGTSAASIASSALNTARDVARPLMNRPRRSSSNVPQTTSSRFVEHASHGGKVILGGISHSLGKTGSAINQLRHTGDNRVSLPSSTLSPGPSCVVWISGRRYPSLFVLGDGLVRTFPTRTRKSPSGATGPRTPRLSRYKDFKLPGLPEDTIAPAVKRIIDPEEYLDLMDREDAGNNTMVLDARPRPPQDDPSAQSSIPQAEIESSAPYQPFHTDKRVAIYEYAPQQPSNAQQVALVSEMLGDSLQLEKTKSSKSKRKPSPSFSPAPEPVKDTSVWVFGQPIESTRLDLGHYQVTEEESFNMSTDDTRALPPSAIERERVLQRFGENDEQIVVTTRRRRGAGRAADADADDDGFFEDDCEVLDFADQRV